MGDHEVKAATAFFDIVNGFLKSMPWRYGFETMRIAQAVRQGLRPAADWLRRFEASNSISLQ